jgi:conjugative transposon TraM protein
MKHMNHDEKNLKRKPPSDSTERKRKMLLFLPLMVIPFLTLLFWTLGGGRGNKEEGLSRTEGLNTTLPDAALKEEKGLDKLSFYELAQQDSVKLEEGIESDPYLGPADTATPSLGVTNPFLDHEDRKPSSYQTPSLGLKTSPFNRTNTRPEDELMLKVTRLQAELDRPAPGTVKKEDASVSASNDQPFAAEVDRLESMMQAMTTPNGEDPEIRKLETTLDKLLDVQHPERVRERLKEKSLQNKRAVFAVDTHQPLARVSLLDTGDRSVSPVRFHSVNKKSEAGEHNCIEAVVHQSQALVDGAVIKLRLLSDIYINGALVPRHTFVFGNASLRGERLEISIPSIKYGASIFPVNLQVVDLDGLSGISIPGAMTRDVAKQAASEAAGAIDIANLDPSFKAKATSLGVNTAKSMLQKKAKLVRVTVKGGYKVLLQNNQVY